MTEQERKEKREAERQAARNLHDAGYNFHQIAEMLGYTHTTIKTWCMPEYARKRLMQNHMAKNERRRKEMADKAEIARQERTRRIRHAVSSMKAKRERGELADVVTPVKGAKIGAEISRLRGQDLDPRNKTERINGDPLPHRRAQARTPGRYERKGLDVVPRRNEMAYLRKEMQDLM